MVNFCRPGDITYIAALHYLPVLILFAGPSKLTVNITENIVDLSVFIQWNVADDFLPTTFTVIWISEKTRAKSHTLIEQSSYTVTGLTLDTVYTITVTPANRCGTGLEYRTDVSFPTGS